MPKRSAEHIEMRKQEIMDACEKLYQIRGFREITLKDIGGETSFSRTLIYNYFHTKEEIFLAIFEREYKRWTASLEKILQLDAQLERRILAKKIAESVEKRQLLLKLLSMNLYDMEANSRPERLVEFKVEFGGSMRALESILRKFCPEMTRAKRQKFIYAFFPFMFGLYPYAVVTEKQKQAMKDAGINYSYQSIYHLTLSCLEKLFGIEYKTEGGKMN